VYNTKRKKMSRIIVIDKDNNIYSTESEVRHSKIVEHTFRLQESIRVVKFKNDLGDSITIPMEFIKRIVK
jgi:hypothetical protein